MGKLNCVFLDRTSIDCDDLDWSGIASQTEFKHYDTTTDDEVVGRSVNADIVIVNKVKLGDKHFSRLPKLKLVCVIATGTNNIDFDAAAKHDVKICNVTDYGAAAVSQHVFMLILALSTRFMDYQKDIAEGQWQAQDQFCLLSHPMQELKGKTLGLIGYGHIAQAVEKIALSFAMKVVIADSIVADAEKKPGRLSLESILSEADIISLHCPLSEHSLNLIAKQELQLMKPSSILINTARGGVVNEADLLEALKAGEIAGAGVDCLAEEPPATDNPMITANLPQLIITPHNAWGALQARQRLVDGTSENIRQFIEPN